ncbi:MAG: ATP-binding protein, partial [Cyanobacteria bacterium J06648_11]
VLNVHDVIVQSRTILDKTVGENIELAVRQARDLWLVKADENSLQRVIHNLVVNARDAMPEGGTLTITARNRDGGTPGDRPSDATEPHVTISVADTGVGIPPDIVNRIFDPFFTTKEVGKGTGLGLSAVLGIVKSHGGRVDVRSAPGQGCCFEIALPACHVTAEPEQTDVRANLKGRGELILVADDEETIRQVLRSTLETHHYRVITARNGVEAIAICRQHSTNISGVLANLMMPEMDGYAFLSELRQFNPEVACIAMSGLSTSEVVECARQSGFNRILPKPFAPQDVLALLNQLLAPV